MPHQTMRFAQFYESINRFYEQGRITQVQRDHLIRSAVAQLISARFDEKLDGFTASFERFATKRLDHILETAIS